MPVISGNVPKHLLAAARSGFLTALRQTEMPWRRVAAQFNMDAKAIDLVDLGASPMPTEAKTGVTVQAIIEKHKQITPTDWDITVGVSQNALNDDQTGNLDSKFRQAGANFQKHINKQVFTVLNAGDATTYGLAYDGQQFFDSDHVDKGAAYQTNQDNEFATNLSLDNFETAWVAARQFRDDQGEFTEYDYDLLVVHPSNVRIAEQIASNREAYDTANREINPFAGGGLSYIVSAHLDTNAWMLIASSENVKPLILGMREQSHLQASWFDSTAGDGGAWFFKFFARYAVHYGDWRLAALGQT